MKTLVLIILVCSFALSAYSQDTIYRTNGKISAVTIRNSDYNNIYYKYAGDTASPVFTISKFYIRKIMYQDGHTETFSSPAVETKKIQPVSIQIDSQDSLKNIIHFNASDLVFGSIGFEYERFMKSGNFSIKLPVSMGFTFHNTEAYGLSYYKDKLLSTGLGFYFYPLPSGDLRFFVGVSLNYWKNKDFTTESGQGTAYWSKMNETKRNSYSMMLQGGILFQMKNRLVLSMDAGIGYGSYKYRYSFESTWTTESRTSSEILIDLRGTLKIGYKF